jgi:uncharacterized repeat protein (TIGR01451 family)
MKEQLKKRRGLLAFVGGALVLVALLSLGTTTWATPDQGPENQTVTIPPIKTTDKAVVNVGDVAVYEIELNNPATPPWNWENVVVTDTIDSDLWDHDDSRKRWSGRPGRDRQCRRHGARDLKHHHHLCGC